MITIKLRPKDEIASAQVVYETSLLTFITTGGTVMRCQVSDISLLGRSTQGVTILNVSKNDRLAALSVEEPEDEEERSQNVLFSMNGDGDGIGKIVFGRRQNEGLEMRVTGLQPLSCSYDIAGSQAKMNLIEGEKMNMLLQENALLHHS